MARDSRFWPWSPVVKQVLLAACADAGLTSRTVRPVDLLHGVGNLCIGTETDPDYAVDTLVDLLLDGLLVD